MHIGIEVQYESRKATNARTGFDQTFVAVLCLDETIPPDFQLGQFWNAVDDVVALEFAYSITPEVRYLPDYSGATVVLILQSIAVEQVSGNSWKMTAVYRFNINTGTGGDRGQGPGNTEALPYTQIGFTIGGGTKTVLRSDQITLGPEIRDDLLAVIPVPPNPHNAIGWAEDGTIEGVEIPAGTFRFQITVYYFPVAVTMDFCNTIASVQRGTTNKGSYNDSTYLQRPAGEVSLLSATGSGTVVDVIPITFEFEFFNNLEDVEDPGFTNLNVLGAEHIDYTFLEEFDPGAGIIILRPSMRTVHRVRHPEDYSLLKIPGA